MRRLFTMCVLIVSSLSVGCSHDVKPAPDPLPTRLDSKRQGSTWAPHGSPDIVPEEEDDGAFGKNICAAPPSVPDVAFPCSEIAPVIDGQSTIEQGLYVLT